MKPYSVENGAFAELSNGQIFYQWHGKTEGPVLVLVHGLTTPSFVWRDMVPSLVTAGYRVLTFDHFGRGYSGHPKQPQTYAFFTKELTELLDHLKVSDPIHLLGYSMGGGIVADFSARNPARIDHLIMLAPAGFRAELGGFFDWAARARILGDLAMSVFGGYLIRKGAQATEQSENVDKEIIALQCHETRQTGFAAAVLSSIRHVTGKNLHSVHAQISAHNIPSLAIFASDDTVIPISGADGLAAANPSTKIVRIADAGHCLAYTHADQVNAAILDFLSDT